MYAYNTSDKVLKGTTTVGVICKDGVVLATDTRATRVKAVVSAMKRDAASGDSFDVAIISTKGYKELTEEEKKSITEAKA